MSLAKMKQKGDIINPPSSKRVKISEDRNIEYEIEKTIRTEVQPKGVFKQHVSNGNSNAEDEGEELLFELEPMKKKRNKSFKAGNLKGKGAVGNAVFWIVKHTT